MSKTYNPLNRRDVLAAAATATVACAAPVRGDELPAIRRIVTGEGNTGRSKILFDGPPPMAIVLNGSTITRLWETQKVPAALPLSDDVSLTAGNAYREGFEGTSFYVADIPGRDSAVPIPMHKEPSVDYMAVLSGEIVLVLDDEETVMRAGDVLVQGGNNDTWENRTDTPCRLLVVVLRAEAE